LIEYNINFTSIQMKSLAVIALLFATSYAAPTIRQRLGQVKETKLAQVEADCPTCGGGCPCDVDYPVFEAADLPGAGNLDGDLGDGIVSAGYGANVQYNVATEFIPTTTTQTRSAAESCAHVNNSGKQGSCGVRTRHFDISGGICVNEWVDSCVFECGWENSNGCSAKAQTCVSGLADIENPDVEGSIPTGYNLTVDRCHCECDHSA
jgi:hypothetical protein